MDLSILALVDEGVVCRILWDKHPDLFNGKGESYSIHKTWVEMGLDDLDCVEMLMEIESQLNIAINDEIAIKYFDLNSRPRDLPGFKSHLREEKINIILDGTK